MQLTNRKSKRIAKKRKIKFFLGTFVCLLCIGAGIYLFIAYGNKPQFISPLPQNVLGDTATDEPGVELLKKELKKQRIEFETISEENDAYVMHLKNKARVVISKDKNIKSQIASLQFILTRLTMEGKLFTQLDLRFDKPVIR